MTHLPTQKRLIVTSGVSTIELVIVVAMLCVIVGFAVFNLIKGNENNSRQKITVDFANQVQKARLDSMRRQAKDINEMAQVKVFNRRSYSIAIDGDEDGQLDVPLVMNLPADQDVEINGPFPKTFIFDGFGQPVDQSNHRVSPQQVIVSNGSGTSAVKFSETGEVTVAPVVKLATAE